MVPLQQNLIDFSQTESQTIHLSGPGDVENM
jgi:hypothetical protein